jgi:transposase-like protein
LIEHPNHEPLELTLSENDNSRNGKSKKGLLTDHCKMEIIFPRHHNGSFEPELVRKHLLSYPDYIRKVICTANEIESMNRLLRKVTKTEGLFPNGESALELLYLGLRNISKKRTMLIRLWKKALNQFVILFLGRLVYICLWPLEK